MDKVQLIGRLFPLVDRMYEHGPALTALGIKSFEIDQAFIYSVIGDEEGVAEQRANSKLMAKSEILQTNCCPPDVRNELLRLEEKQRSTGNLWDDQPTRYLRAFHRIRFQAWERLAALENQANLQIHEAWQDEVSVHSHDEHVTFEPDSVESRRNLVQQMVTRLWCGFELDRRLSRKSLLVYAKPCSDLGKFFLIIPQTELAKPVELHRQFIMCRSSNNLLSRPLGPSFSMAFGVADAKMKGALSSENKQVLPLKFEWFLPIRKGPLWSDYSYFYTLRELEALVNIHFCFYSIIASEFELAASDTLAGSETSSHSTH